MKLKLLLPFRVFTEQEDVRRMVVETMDGSYGLLPHRLDCVAALVPGVLIYETQSQGEVYVAVDEGILVKAGDQVFISVRNAIGGTDLGQLRAQVHKEFMQLDAHEREVRSLLAKLESGFVRRFASFQHE